VFRKEGCCVRLSLKQRNRISSNEIRGWPSSPFNYVCPDPAHGRFAQGQILRVECSREWEVINLSQTRCCSLQELAAHELFGLITCPSARNRTESSDPI